MEHGLNRRWRVIVVPTDRPARRATGIVLHRAQTTAVRNRVPTNVARNLAAMAIAASKNAAPKNAANANRNAKRAIEKRRIASQRNWTGTCPYAERVIAT